MIEVIQVNPVIDAWQSRFKLFVRAPSGSRVPSYREDQLPSAGEFDSEYAFNPDTDKYNRNWLHLNCPRCGRCCSPFMTPFLVKLEHGWRWVGLDHREPYSEWQARCPGCKGWYRFGTYIPQ